MAKMTIEEQPDEETSRKARILYAAREVFSEVGLSAARVEEIARRAGCNKALIYYYFDSKEALYDAVFASVVEQGMPFWDAVRGAGFHEWLDGLANASTRPEDRPWMRLIAMEGLDEDRPRHPAASAERARTWRECVQLLVRAQAHGEIDPDLDSEMLLLMFVMNTLGSQTLGQFTQMITGQSPHTPAFTDRLRRFHISMADKLRPQDGATRP